MSMSEIQLEPVNLTAVRILKGGEHYQHNGQVGANYHFETCPPLVDPKRLRLSTPNLTGRRFGRFEVVGMAATIPGTRNTGGRWVVRCSCGDYEVRTAKAIKNLSNGNDMCHICRKHEQTLRW